MIAPGHGRGEQHGLARRGGLGQDPLHVGQEAEVEHLVGLVEHQGLDLGQVERAAVGDVEQPARGADHDVHAVGEGVELGLVADTAVDGEDADPEVGRSQGQVTGHLAGELASGGDDEGLRLAGLGQVGVRRVAGPHDALEQRDAEGQRLAGAGAGLADQVGAQERDRQGHLLDREGLDDAAALEGVGDLGEYPEVSERRQGLAFVSGM